jgi:uracil phosphoribosyltransferase
MVNFVWEMMPGAEVWHIGLYRDERTLRPVEYYNKLPVDPCTGVPDSDPMLATGGSATATTSLLKQWALGASNSSGDCSARGHQSHARGAP